MEEIRKRVGKVGSILEHVGTNDADKVGTMQLLESYRQLVRELKDRRVGRIALSAILSVFNRIAIHFPCVGSLMAPRQGSLWLI